MRFIGISSIILAHIGLSSKTALFQIRTFDVPMMIFISGLAYAGRTTGNYIKFAWRRTKRLIVPVYIFLGIYFLINFILAQAGLCEQIAAKKIAGSFMLRLNPSIGYVWIIRIFLIVMLMTPLLIRLNDLVRRTWMFIALIALLLVGQHFLIAWLKPLKLGWFVNDYLLYILGYSTLFLLGIRMKNATLPTQLLFTGLLAAAFACMAVDIGGGEKTWLQMQSFKYPPRLYYLLWGGAVSSLLWTTQRWWGRLLDLRPVKFIGQNTIWIYLWHIPLLSSPVLLPGESWGWRYASVYGMAVLIFSLQYFIVRRIEARRPEKKNRLAGYLKG